MSLPLANTLRPRQNGRRFAGDTFECIFLNENVRISIKISLKFVPKGPINNNPALVQIMAWRRSGDKPLSEPMMVSLLTHICVTRPQWMNVIGPSIFIITKSVRNNLTSYLWIHNHLSLWFYLPFIYIRLCYACRVIIIHERLRQQPKLLVLRRIMKTPAVW